MLGWEYEGPFDSLDAQNAAGGYPFAKDELQEQGVIFAVSQSQAIELSVKYLLEEMAVFDILVAQNWQVEIYPGTQLPILKEIAKGDFENVPKHLQKRIFIGLNASN